MTSAVTTTALSAPETADLVEDLADELESFAFERERVLAKLDIRAATAARRVARELRLVVRRLAAAPADEEPGEAALTALESLLEEAHRVLEGAVAATAPAVAAPADEGDRPTPVHEEASGLRAIEEAAAQSGDRLTDGSLPDVSRDPDDPEENEQDLTIARRVMWERSGNRILGR